jgi:predicted dehydrogenase
MSTKSNKGVSRRRFLGTALTGLAGLALMPSLKAIQPKIGSKNIKLGFIGMGRQAMDLIKYFQQVPGVDIIAGCDVYGVKRKRFEKKINAWYLEKGENVKVKTYEKYQDLLKNSDVDAVVIAVPDHSHAMIAIAACKAGKDVYLEKPLTFTIKEGQELRRIVRKTKRILAVGSHQRSDPKFQQAVKVVQSGKLGKINQVFAYVGAPPTPYNLPEETLPSDLNWDLWLANLAIPIHFNNQLDPPISIDPDKNETIWGAWRWYKEMGGGFTTDWGAHMFDIAQWGLGMDKNGPVEISPIDDGSKYMKFVYASGTVMTSEPFNEKQTKGVKFIGTEGWLEISREHFLVSDDKFLLDTNAATPPVKSGHQSNFIEAVRERKDPLVPVEIGHSSCTVCTLGNIACELKRTIKWDPSTETFVDDVDGAATKMLHYKYRDGWNLLG